MEKTLVVKGMHCKSCEVLLSDVIGEIKGVSKASADSKKGIVVVEYSDAKALEEARKAIVKEGYKVVG